jgi:hypothetical protein
MLLAAEHGRTLDRPYPCGMPSFCSSYGRYIYGPPLRLWYADLSDIRCDIHDALVRQRRQVEPEGGAAAGT